MCSIRKYCEIIVKDKSAVVELLDILNKNYKRSNLMNLPERTDDGKELIGTIVRKISIEPNYIKFKTESIDYDLVLDYLSFRGIEHSFRCIDIISGALYGSVYDETGEFFQIGCDSENEIDFEKAEDWYCQCIDESYIENLLK